MGKFVKSPKLPKKQGKIDIYPEIENGRVSVTIIGTPEGLKYLARLLDFLADFDQERSDAPDDTREHTHLHAGCQLGEHSCEVELCRADAKGTGELPSFMTGRTDRDQ